MAKRIGKWWISDYGIERDGLLWIWPWMRRLKGKKYYSLDYGVLLSSRAEYEALIRRHTEDTK